MAHDQKCWDLANAFLDDHPHIHTTDNFNELADEIQRTIDEFIADKLRNYDGAPKS
jgi:hypothetical protein